MGPVSATVLLVAVSAGSASAGLVFRDARARGLPTRKALTWAVPQGVEWPLFLLLYRRIRRRRVRGTQPLGPAMLSSGDSK
jgi:hypothetical protein